MILKESGVPRGSKLICAVSRIVVGAYVPFLISGSNSIGFPVFTTTACITRVPAQLFVIPVLIGPSVAHVRAIGKALKPQSNNADQFETHVKKPAPNIDFSKHVVTVNE